MNLKTILMAAAFYMPSCNHANKPETRFELEVLNQDKPTIVDFYTDWCGPCIIARPHFERLSEEYLGRVNFVSYDCDKDRETCDGYDIHAIPAFIFFKGREEVNRLQGFQGEQDLRSFIDSCLSD